MKIRSLLLLSLLAVPLAAQGHFSAADLKREIDLSLRWLRYQQDLKTGSYGDSVELTALALKTFAESPRHYGISDGPFISKAVGFLLRSQRPNGAICDPGTVDQQARMQSADAAIALLRIGTPEVVAAAKRAERFGGLFDPGDEWTPEDALAGFKTEDLLQKARDQLDRREPQGYWKSPMKIDPIFSTAMILERLSAYQQVIEGREKKDATPQPPQPLPTF